MTDSRDASPPPGGSEEPELPRPRHPVFALVYDLVLRQVEPQLAPWRRRTCRGARGRVLELGAGTGLNLPYYDWQALSQLVLLEPDPYMARRLRQRMDAAGRPVKLVEAPAEAIPFDDGTFDAVVGVHVFCSVARPQVAASEVVRVLAEDGQLRLLEHVRGHQVRLEQLQDRITPLWRRFAAGCHPNRSTAETLAAAGLQWKTLERFTMPGFPAPAAPHIFGVAHVDPAQPGRAQA